MCETVYYNIGDIIFKVVSDLPYELPHGNAVDFQIESCEPDYTYVFQRVINIPDYIGTASLVGKILFAHDLVNQQGNYIRAFVWNGCYYDSALKMEEKQGTIAYLSSDILAERYRNGFNFFNYFCSERIFAKHDSMVLHSSHIDVNGMALIFSAPSGTGKSTQADLWNEYTGAKIINGDRTLLRKKEGVWRGYGCPMCGTSGIHLQSNEPIRAIIMLEQGKENRITRLSSREAFSLLYAQIVTLNWDREMVLKNLELIDDLITHVPVLKYSCTKTKDAVDVLKEFLQL